MIPSPGVADPPWLEAALRREGGLPGARVREARAEVIGVGFGLDGTVARIAMAGEGGLPPTLVAKWAGAARGEREIAFYRAIAPRLEVPLARFLGGAVDAAADRAILLLEDLAPARQGDMLAGATEEEALALARVEGRLHGAWWGRDLPVPLLRWGRDPVAFTAKVVERRPRFLELWGDRIPAPARELVEEFEERVPAAVEALGTRPATLVHADLHLDNVLFRGDGSPVILDWPEAKRGPAAVDVERLLAEGMTVEVRRRIQDRVLDAWCAAAAVPGYGREALLGDLLPAAVHAFAATAWWAGRDDPRAAEPRVAAIIAATVERHAALVADLLAESR